MSRPVLRVLPRLAAQGVRDMGIHPWTQALTLLAIVLVVFLSGLLLMLLATVDHSLSTAQDETVMQVYWKPGTDAETIQEQWAQLRNMPWLVRHSTFTPEQALEALRSRMGQAAVDVDISFLRGRSPLPASALLHFDPQEADLAAWLRDTTAYLKALPGVDRVLMHPLKTELGRSWRLLSRRVMLPALALLSVVLALVVGNTVRLSLTARQAEIEILQLVGARNWYIRLPLLVSGGLLGLLGGALGVLLALAVYFWLRPYFHFPPLLDGLAFVPLHQVGLLILVPVCMGVVGSFFAVRTRISHPNPAGKR